MEELPVVFSGDINFSEHMESKWRDEELLPEAAAQFLEAAKRQQIYLNPEKYEHFTEEDRKNHFMDPTRLYRMPGEALDFTVI